MTPPSFKVDEDVIRDSLKRKRLLDYKSVSQSVSPDLLHSLEVAVHVLRLGVDELAGVVRAELLQDTLGERAHYQDGSERKILINNNNVENLQLHTYTIQST